MSYPFGLEFQKHILASVITDGNFLRENIDVIKTEHFGDEILAGLYDAAVEFFKGHKEVPSTPAITKIVRQYVAPGRKLSEYVDALREVEALKGKNTRYYQEQAVKFARSQAIEYALRNAVPLLETGDIDEIARLVKDASQVGAGGNSAVYDYVDHVADRAHSYANGNGTVSRLATGISALDESMSGGLGIGEIGVVVALPGFGKTTTLVNIAARALLQNKRVAYVTLELSRDMIASKFDTCLFGRSMKAIKEQPKVFAKAFNEFKESLTGKLTIHEYPTKSLTVDRLGAEILKMGGVDVVLVDYGQLVKPEHGRSERRYELTEVYEALRRMAGELQTRVWTAHQSNRPGTHVNTIRAEHIAEDFNVVGIADIVLSVNYNDEEKKRGLMRYFIAKSRIGPSHIAFECNVNWMTARITGGN